MELSAFNQAVGELHKQRPDGQLVLGQTATHHVVVWMLHGPEETTVTGDDFAVKIAERDPANPDFVVDELIADGHDKQVGDVGYVRQTRSLKVELFDGPDGTRDGGTSILGYNGNPPVVAAMRLAAPRPTGLTAVLPKRLWRPKEREYDQIELRKYEP